MQDSEILDLIEAEHKRIDRKYANDPSYILRKRVVNTAGDVIRKIQNIEFEDLTMDLYFICNEVGYKFFSEKYRNVIEFAKLFPEKLSDKLYHYYRDIAKTIKKENRLSDFFMFMSIFEEASNISEKHRDIFLAYMDILVEQTEFLRPNLYNHNQLIAGVTTEGEVLVIPDPFPNIDLPAYELTRSKKKGKEAIEFLAKSFKKYGYSIDRYDEVHSSSNSFINNVNLLVPYINEFTYDMLPEKPYPPRINIQYVTAKDLDFTEMLRSRRKTLPTNGLVVNFKNSIFFEKILLKEVFHNGSIHMLCKFFTLYGDITVRYNTKTGSFFSPFDHQFGYFQDFHLNLKRIALWIYASYVCPTEKIIPTEEAYHGFTDDNHAEVTFSSIGGKLRATLSSKTNSHLDLDKYMQKSISIAGYIRKLPEGQKASEDKIALATSLGLSLADDETYVEPFIRQSWVLKIKQDV